MSNYYLCDYCATHHWTTEDGLFVCEGRPFQLEKVVMVDHHGKGGIRYRNPEDVCKCYKQKEDA